MAIKEIQKGEMDWHLPINENFKALEDMIKGVALVMYPVGSIYMSTASTNPKTLFGGTWIAWGAGRVPVGVNASDTDFSTVEKTGGEKAHVLTIAESPAHTHTTSVYWSGGGNDKAYPAGTESSEPIRYNVDPETSSVGGGQAHNNLQPYITCYMWKRVA